MGYFSTASLGVELDFLKVRNMIESLIDATNGSGEPLLCLEVNPPRGVDVEMVFERIEGRAALLDFFNVTDSALARMRMAPVPFAAQLKQRFSRPALVNLSCRDRNLIALQGDLLAAYSMGIATPVALTGDAVSVGDSPERKGVFEVNSLGLLKAIATLNSGVDLAGNSLTGKPNFRPGVVVNPNVRNPTSEIKRLQRKKDAGATFALSQPVFDLEVARVFFDEMRDFHIPIMLGLLPFKRLESLNFMSNIPGIKVSDKLIAKCEQFAGKDLGDFAIDHCVSLAEGLKPYVCGFHVVSGTTPKLALELVEALSTKFVS